VAAVIAAGVPGSEEELTEHCRERLAGYKVPRTFVFVDSVRRTPVGKPDYAWALDHALSRLT
jgi:3-oxocholest-4-en-26-oate---CoA ligase